MAKPRPCPSIPSQVASRLSATACRADDPHSVAGLRPERSEPPNTAVALRDGQPAPLGAVLGYSIEHAGVVTGVKRDTIYRAIRRGELTARKIGSRTVILTDDLRAWMLSRPAIEPRQAA